MFLGSLTVSYFLPSTVHEGEGAGLQGVEFEDARKILSSEERKKEAGRSPDNG